MSVQGNQPALTPLSQAQIRAAADLGYARLDGTNRPLHVFNNALMNPSFEWWQRGTGTFTASGTGGTAYGPDRWRVYNSGPNGSTAVSRIALAIADQPSLSRYAAQVSTTGHTAAGDSGVFQQPIEGVDTFAGKRVVATGKIRQIGATGAKVFLELAQNFGTGGSAEVDTQSDLNGSQVTLTNAFQTFGLTFNVPSMSGKIIGTANDLLALNIWLSAGANFNARTNNLGLQSISIQLVDLEIKEIRSGFGDQYPGFERLPKFVDFDNCLRYYEQSVESFNMGGVNLGALGMVHPNQNFRYSVRYRKRKRVNPTFIIYDTQGNPGSVSCYTSSWQYAVGYAFANGVTDGFYIGHNVSGSIETQFNYAAIAEF